MTIEIDPTSPVPLYLQIAGQLRRLIALGAVRPGEKLPTVRELAVGARVNRNTAARAIQHLESESVVRTRVGQGTFVLDHQGTDGSSERVLDEAIDRLLVEAHTRGLPFDRLERRISRRIEFFQKSRRDAWSRTDRPDEEPA